MANAIRGDEVLGDWPGSTKKGQDPEALTLE